jgi:acetyl-CoA carboxylase biotin carboxyl carrier protein
MFKFEEICELIRLVGSSKVSKVEIEHGGTTLRIEGPVQVAAPVHVPGPPSASAVTPPPAPTGAGGDAAPAEEAADDGVHVVTSPIVGTFYRAPNPDAEPYVKVGDTVATGQVLCIVEAMKLMNEIESDVDGTVVKVFSDNAAPVEYGAPLFAIKSA